MRLLPKVLRRYENIIYNTKSILKEFNLIDKLVSFIFVTDNGKNIVSALKPYKRLACAYHSLNLVMEDLKKNNRAKREQVKATVNAMIIYVQRVDPAKFY